MKKKLFIMISVASLFFAGYWFFTSNKEDIKEVDVVEAVQQTITNSFTVSGALIFRQDIKLKSEVTGKINEILVKDGQSISKGDLLLRIGPEVSQSEVDGAKANVQIEEINIERHELEISNTQKQWERKRRLFEKGLINKEEFDNLTNQLDIAKLNLKSSQGTLLRVQAELDKAKDNLEKTMVRSPIDGIVANVKMSVGETVYAGGQTGSGSLLMKVADPSEVLAEVTIDERDISKVKVGQRADIKVMAFPGRQLSGVVESIAAAAETNKSYEGGLNFQAKILLDKKPDLKDQFEGIRSGMRCRAEIKILNRFDVLTVSSMAIQYNLSLEETLLVEGEASNMAYVFVAENGAVKRKEVQLGVSNDMAQEVLSGISIGEKIIIGPYSILQNLKNGDSIKVMSY